MRDTEKDFGNGNISTTQKNYTTEDLKRISKYRKALPQFLATSAMYLNLFDMGMSLGFPTIMLSAVQNGTESLTFSQEQASWFASLMFIFQPVGSLISSFVLEYLGRKNTLIIINIPFFLIWIVIHLSESVTILMFSSIVLAINIGFCEPPAINYAGEISTPKLRGILTSYSAPIIYLGIIFEFVLGKLYHWRVVALINSSIPILTIAAMIQIPESPMWLLSKGHRERAEKALCWLRGWVKPEYVAKEFKYLLNYKDETCIQGGINEDDVINKVYTIEEKTNGPMNGNINGVLKHSPSSGEIVKKYKQDYIENNTFGNQLIMKGVRFYDINLVENNHFNSVHMERQTISEILSNSNMFAPEYMKPFFLVSMYFMFYYMSGISSIRPYLLAVIEELKIPIDPKTSAIFVPLIGLVGSVVSMCVIKKIGKRPLSLISIAGAAFGALTCGILSCLDNPGFNILPFIMFLVLAFFTSLGIAAIPWMLMSEVFPLRGRGLASGLVAAVAYTLAFVTAKTFLDLHDMLGLHGVFFLYGTFSVLGFFYFYFYLPETEGKTLHEIEMYFKESCNDEKKIIGNN